MLYINEDYNPDEQMLDSHIQDCEDLVSIIQEKLNKMKFTISSMKDELAQLKSEKKSK